MAIKFPAIAFYEISGYSSDMDTTLCTFFGKSQLIATTPG